MCMKLYDLFKKCFLHANTKSQGLRLRLNTICQLPELLTSSDLPYFDEA